MHDDDLIAPMEEVCLCYNIHTGVPNLCLSHQHDIVILEDEELLCQLRINYTPVMSTIPGDNFPSTLTNTNEPRKLLWSCHRPCLTFWIVFSRGSVLAGQWRRYHTHRCGVPWPIRAHFHWVYPKDCSQTILLGLNWQPSAASQTKDAFGEFHPSTGWIDFP